MNDITQEIAKNVKDAAYVAVGLSVMGVQKAQVRRRELIELARKQLPGLEAPLNEARAEFAKRVKEIDEQIETIVARVEEALQPVEQRLPATAQAVIGQAKDARTQLRSYVLAALAA
ncbi:MAG TPA: hypothetical protein VGS21_05540 [Acidimicrobiales bacterium]|nr:hypothetical protein [Acidimicrobiales bacterium]